MVQTYSDEHKVYSVDMMFLWTAAFRPKPTTVSITSIPHEGWQEGRTNITVDQIYKNPKNPKYRDHFKRIQKADLSYPLLVVRNTWKRGQYNIVDGAHRLAKALQKGLTTIQVHILTDSLLKKFWLCERKDWDFQQAENLLVQQLFQCRFRVRARSKSPRRSASRKRSQ